LQLTLQLQNQVPKRKTTSHFSICYLLDTQPSIIIWYCFLRVVFSKTVTVIVVTIIVRQLNWLIPLLSQWFGVFKKYLTYNHSPLNILRYTWIESYTINKTSKHPVIKNNDTSLNMHTRFSPVTHTHTVTLKHTHTHTVYGTACIQYIVMRTCAGTRSTILTYTLPENCLRLAWRQVLRVDCEIHVCQSSGIMFKIVFDLSLSPDFPNYVYRMTAKWASEIISYGWK